MENIDKTETSNGKISDINMNAIMNEMTKTMNGDKDSYMVSANDNILSQSSLQQPYSLQFGPINSNWDTYVTNSSYTTISKAFCHHMLSYTNLDGNEEIINLDISDIDSIRREKSSKLVFTRKFPFVKNEEMLYTVLTYTKDNIMKCLKMLESPSLIAKKLGIEYAKTSPQDLVDDDLLGN